MLKSIQIKIVIGDRMKKDWIPAIMKMIMKANEPMS